MNEFYFGLPFALIISFCLFSFSCCITPGPNNTTSLFISLNYGWRKSMPYVIGTGIGGGIILLITGYGFEYLNQYPIIIQVLKYASCLYLCYLAYLLWNTKEISIDNTDTSEKSEKSVVPGFYYSVIFQLINPKVWIFIAGVLANWLSKSQNPQVSIYLLTFIHAVMCIMCVSSWALFGQIVKKTLTKPRSILLFNRVMAGSLVASLLTVF